MAKRVATRDLNHDNWNDEEEVEEAGTFVKADQKTLQTRVIKTAKRRFSGTAGEADSPKNPFSEFKGFGGVNSTPNSKTAFAFLSQASNSQIKEDKSSENTAKPFANLFAQSSKPLTSSGLLAKDSSPMSDSSDNQSVNLETLKELNLACSKWITDHLVKNPFCILTPIFKDYEKHLASINLVTKPKETNAEKVKPVSSFTFGQTSAAAVSLSVNNGSSESEKKEPPPSFQFKSTGILSGGTGTGFTFSASKPTFSFTNIQQKPAEHQAEESKPAEEESDEPPKNEFVPVVEDDSVYDIRCKVFVKKDGEYKSKGVGTLFLKPVAGNKTQLLVRADTSIGNILLNLLVSSNLPMQKMGKSDVMLVCLPTPESKPPPVPVLIRVKTAQDRDQLLSKLEECKPTA